MDQNQHQQQQRTINSGLMRYRSAPSSYFTNLINSSGVGSYGVGLEDLDPFISPRLPSPETESILARFVSGSSDSTHVNLSSERNNMANEAVQSSTQFVGTMKHETEVFHQNHPYSSASHVVYEGQSSPQPDKLGSSMNMDRLPQMKISVGGSNSNLIRHSSSPAGLFAQINAETGYSVMREIGDFSSSGPSSWDDSVLLSDNFLKGIGENDRANFSNFNSRENQESEGGNLPDNNVLTHHLSLPTSSSELSAMEKLLHFQDSVPLKIRAKRGCATHPRSIAERVRRTRISERMRKLQDLVPNMDKQTNTADMLDLAVDYIKDLQNQVTTLTDLRGKCKCSK